MLEAIWFGLAAVMLAIYVVMDGFDFGAGGLHLAVARHDRERRQVLAAIGPFWDGNEVWLLAGGGVLFLAFPKVLGSGLSGFYLAIFLFLWTLILRGVSIELRSHLEDAMWRTFWDTAFTVASIMAPVLLGAALGNVLRGVPIGEDGWFALPLFDSFLPSGALGVLDWYTVLCGLFALAAVLHHGALFLAWKTDRRVRDRSRAASRALFVVTATLWAAATIATAQVAPHILAGLAQRPLAWIATAIFLAGLLTSWIARRSGRDLIAFLGSSAFLLGILSATATAAYPTWLLSTLDPAWSLTAANASAAPGSLRAGLYWWPVGFVLAIAYFAVLFRLHRGKAQTYDEPH